MRNLGAAASLLMVLTLVAAPLRAHAEDAGKAPAGKGQKAEDRDRKAKALFAAGRYQEAIDLLAQLYADTGNPTYLRNIGRCHQRLHDPERAISSFEEYLLRAKDITPAERDEVKGFIREMEELKSKQA